MEKIARGIAFSLLALLTLPATGQNYPAKPVRIIATVAPAGGVDIVARLVAPKMTESMGQPIIIENVAALGGSMGAERLSRMAPDGYNLMFTTPSSVVSIFFLKKQTPYKLADFTPITAAVEPVTALLVNAASPGRSLRELLDLGRRYPGKLSYGTPGIGSVFHLMGEALAHDAGLSLLHVPYKSVVAAVNDVASGQTDIVLSAISNVRPMIASGKLRVLAVLESSRYAGLPDVPTAGEIVPGHIKPASWFGVFGPAGLPAPITRRVQVELTKALNAADVKPKLDDAGLVIIGNTPEEFAALIKRGFEVYGEVVRAAGLKPED